MSMLVPVKDAESGKSKPETLIPTGATGTTQVEDKGFDTQINMDKLPNLTDEMRELTGEKKREWRPLVQVEEVEDEVEKPAVEQAKPQPVTPAEKSEVKQDNPAPSADPAWLDELVDVGGKKMKARDAFKSYEELQREWGRKGQEFGSERAKYKAEIAKLEAERKFLEEMAATNFAGISKTSNPNVPQPAMNTVTKEKVLEMIDRGEAYEAIMSVVADRELALKAELDQKNAALIESRRKAEAEEKARYQKETIAQTIEAVRNDPDCKSFSENQSKFALWLEDVYGNDEAGLGKINDLCMEAPKVKRMYQRYLKDTVDLTAALQQAQAQGQAIAQVKERLAPVADMSSLIPSNDNPDRNPKQRPVRDDIDDMEGFIFKGMHRAPLSGKPMFR